MTGESNAVMVKLSAQKKKHKVIKFNCGIISGFVQTALFNPWDRALYLTIKEDRKFLDLRNFNEPYHGLLQTLVQRTVSAGIYFPLEDLFREYIIEKRNQRGSTISDQWIYLVSGNLAGAVSGLLLNPLAAVKYHSWGVCETKRQNFFKTCYKMYGHGGFKPFLNGTSATVSRDMIFGGCFSAIRHGLYAKFDASETGNEWTKFFIDMFAATSGTIISSPLNYVRNFHYSTHPSVGMQSFSHILGGLWTSAKAEGPFLNRVVHLQRQLRVGWGTLRVGCGMAVGSKVYSAANDMFMSS